MKKIILIAVVVVLAAIGAGIAFLSSNLDGIVKKIIETAGSDAAGVKVSVGDVKISLTEGTASLSGLTVANPSGFNTPHAFKLGAIDIVLDTGSLTGNPIVVKSVMVAAPEVTYEMGGSGSNIDVIQKNVAAKTGSGKASEPASKDDAGKKVVIDKLTIAKGAATMAAPLPGVKGTAVLPVINLTGIGRKSGGASPAEVAKQVLDALTKAAVNAGSSMGIGQIGDVVKGAVPGDMGGALKGLMGK